MTHSPNKHNDMKRQMRMLAIFLVPLVALVLGAATPDLWAGSHDNDDEIPFDVAELFFELNDTDGDLGIHALIDGEAWKRLTIEDTKERKMLDVKVKGRLRKQGLTEIFFESAEPTFDELAPRKFFRRFPEGIYEIEGEALEGAELESETELTHVMPAPPEIATVNGEEEPFENAPDDCEEDPLPTISGDVTVAWDQVTTSHPDIGDPKDSGDIDIIRYQAVAEWEDDEGTFVSSIDLLPPAGNDRMSVTFPANFFKSGAEVKFEVLVREASFNQTAVESCPFEYK